MKSRSQNFLDLQMQKSDLIVLCLLSMASILWLFTEFGILMSGGDATMGSSVQLES